MREYKFRGKRKDNGDWVHGYYLIVDNKHLIFPPNAHFDQIGYYSKNGCFGEILQEGTCWICEVDRESVGQFTGLKDNNGKEVYEGDILKDNKGKVYEIVWGHDLLWLAKTNEKQGNCYCPKGLVEHGAVVAGNRWDNPELMKEGSV